jgi:hypothetical protein
MRTSDLRMRLTTPLISITLLCLLSIGLVGVARADSRNPLFDSDDPGKLPLSVPLSQIEQRINSDPTADGIQMSITVKDRVMRLDVVAMPGTTSMAAATRLVFMTARLAKPDYDEMRFSDEGQDLYVISGETIRGIGRQFVWGEHGKGQNPIYLMRLFVDALHFPDGSRAAPPFPGSLLGDTSLTTQFMARSFNQNWIMRNTKVLK